MSSNRNTITWFSRITDQRRDIEVTRVTLFHPRGAREADRMTVVFDDGPHRCRMMMSRQPDHRFAGSCEVFAADSDAPIRTYATRCLLLDTLGASALTLSLIPWVGEGGEEFDWMGSYKNVQRVTGAEPC